MHPVDDPDGHRVEMTELKWVAEAVKAIALKNGLEAIAFGTGKRQEEENLPLVGSLFLGRIAYPIEATVYADRTVLKRAIKNW